MALPRSTVMRRLAILWPTFGLTSDSNYHLLSESSRQQFLHSCTFQGMHAKPSKSSPTVLHSRASPGRLGSFCSLAVIRLESVCLFALLLAPQALSNSLGITVTWLWVGGTLFLSSPWGREGNGTALLVKPTALYSSEFLPSGSSSPSIYMAADRWWGKD